MSKEYYINDVDIDKYVEKGLITTLRYMFHLGDRFYWDFDEKHSEISIVTEFPNRNVPHKETSIVLTGLDWTSSNMAALNQDIAEPIYKGDVHVGDSYRTVINFNCRFVCQADGMNSKDIANKVASILMFTGKKVLDKYGITIYNINKGPTRPSLQASSKLFQTEVGISASVTWQGVFKHFDIADMDILKKIELSVEVIGKMQAGNNGNGNNSYVGPDTYTTIKK